MQEPSAVREVSRPRREALRARLKAAEDTLRAIHADEVDALGPDQK